MIFGIKSSGTFPASKSFAFSRIVETAAEAIPLAVLQALALFTTQSTTQYISLTWSVLSIVYTFVSVAFAFDKSEENRVCHPRLYGFIQDSNEIATGIAIGLFDLGYVCSKLIAVASLGHASGVALVVWLAGECATLLLVRVKLCNWRIWTSAGDSTSASLLTHVVVYLLVLAAPVLPLRNPHVLTPSVYASSVAWSLFGANPIMMTIAYKVFEDSSSADAVRARVIMLIASTAVGTLGAALSLASIGKPRRSTFHKHCTCATYTRTYAWNEQVSITIGGELHTNCEREMVRAYQVIGSTARCYWPTDLVERFIAQNWCVLCLALAY